MGLYRRPDSPNWWMSIGEDIRESTETPDKEQAEECYLHRLNQEWRRKKLGDHTFLPFKIAAQRWLDHDGKKRKAERHLLRWLMADDDGPRLGLQTVADVAEADAISQLREFILETKECARNTVDRHMAVISAVLNHTHKSNRAAMPHPVWVPMYRDPVGEPGYFTPEEFTRLTVHLSPVPHQRLASRLGVLTLLRMRALLGLTRDRIDLKRRQGWIPAASQKNRETFVFPISADAAECFEELLDLSEDGHHLFTYRGAPLDDVNTDFFKQALQLAKIHGKNWHTHRHTGATWLVQAGVPLFDVMHLGGWKSLKMVLRYAHHAEAQGREAAERLARAMATGAPTDQAMVAASERLAELAQDADREAARLRSVVGGVAAGGGGGGGAGRDRTGDLFIANEPLSQLSYGPTQNAHVAVSGTDLKAVKNLSSAKVLPFRPRPRQPHVANVTADKKNKDL